MTAFAGDNIWDFHDPDDDLSETFEGNIALQYAWKQLMGEKRSAKTIDEVNRHAAEKIANWNRLGEKAYSGRTQNAQNIATIGSLVGSGISIASPMLADKWWGSKPPTDLGTGAADSYLMDTVHPGVNKAPVFGGPGTFA